MRSTPVAGRKLGWSVADVAAKPFAKFWNPAMRPLPAHVVEALNRGPVAEPLVPGVQEAGENLFGGRPVLETGYALHAGGALHINVLTDMPGVSPEMIDWWFAWHGDDAAKYKLWHPHAHIHAQWREPPPKTGDWRARYVGQTSVVDEYVGSNLLRLSISFVEPKTLGLIHPSLDDPREGTAICARAGLADQPVNSGYLIHHIRKTPAGSEMRSRFYIGAPYVGPRGSGMRAALTAQAGKMLLKTSPQDGRDLLVHCAEEMQHLASFLPAIYAEFRDRP
jgi:DAPG hydrolase PhiG domain